MIDYYPYCIGSLSPYIHASVVLRSTQSNRDRESTPAASSAYAVCAGHRSLRPLGAVHSSWFSCVTSSCAYHPIYDHIFLLACFALFALLCLLGLPGLPAFRTPIRLPRLGAVLVRQKKEVPLYKNYKPLQISHDLRSSTVHRTWQGSYLGNLGYLTRAGIVR